MLQIEKTSDTYADTDEVPQKNKITKQANHAIYTWLLYVGRWFNGQTDQPTYYWPKTKLANIIFLKYSVLQCTSTHQFIKEVEQNI